MPADTDEDRKRVERRLKKLAGLTVPRSAAGRQVGAGTPRALLSALLTEIDETVLARRLEFRLAGDGPALLLDVYGRRLTGLAAPPPPGLDASLFGTALTEADAPALRGLLERWLAAGKVLSVVASPPDPDRDPLVMGLAARWLAEAWTLPLDTGPLPTEAAALDALAGLPAVAWLRRDRKGAETAMGAEADVARLRTVPDEPPGKPFCTVLGGQAGGTFLVLAQAAGESLRMLVAPAQLAAVAQAWRAVIR